MTIILINKKSPVAGCPKAMKPTMLSEPCRYFRWICCCSQLYWLQHVKVWTHYWTTSVLLTCTRLYLLLLLYRCCCCCTGCCCCCISCCCIVDWNVKPNYKPGGHRTGHWGNCPCGFGTKVNGVPNLGSIFFLLISTFFTPTN